LVPILGDSMQGESGLKNGGNFRKDNVKEKQIMGKDMGKKKGVNKIKGTRHFPGTARFSSKKKRTGGKGLEGKKDPGKVVNRGEGGGIVNK